ncbi:hypothetical protein YQE_00719, partial [Dendroctonus ponderosae]
MRSFALCLGVLFVSVLVCAKTFQQEDGTGLQADLVAAASDDAKAAVAAIPDAAAAATAADAKVAVADLETAASHHKGHMKMVVENTIMAITITSMAIRAIKYMMVTIIITIIIMANTESIIMLDIMNTKEDTIIIITVKAATTIIIMIMDITTKEAIMATSITTRRDSTPTDTTFTNIRTSITSITNSTMIIIMMDITASMVTTMDIITMITDTTRRAVTTTMDTMSTITVRRDIMEKDITATITIITDIMEVMNIIIITTVTMARREDMMEANTGRVLLSFHSRSDESGGIRVHHVLCAPCGVRRGVLCRFRPSFHGVLLGVHFCASRPSCGGLLCPRVVHGVLHACCGDRPCDSRRRTYVLYGIHLCGTCGGIRWFSGPFCGPSFLQICRLCGACLLRGVRDGDRLHHGVLCGVHLSPRDEQLHDAYHVFHGVRVHDGVHLCALCLLSLHVQNYDGRHAYGLHLPHDGLIPLCHRHRLCGRWRQLPNLKKRLLQWLAKYRWTQLL